MGLTLPPELASLLSQAGGQWPEADEDRLHDLAGRWRTLASDLNTLSGDASAVARKVATEHHGESIDAFRGYWGEFERQLSDGINAVEQAASGIDGMAQATLATKTAMVDALSATHSRIQQVRGTAAAIGIGVGVAAVIGILIRILARLLARYWDELLRAIWRWLRPLFRKIGELFKKLWNWLSKLWKRDPKKPKRPPRGFPPRAARKKVPKEWGKGQPTKKSKQGKTGWRWQDPNNKGNTIRIDKGDPNSPFPSQRVDHVVITRNGKIIGRNGEPVTGPKPSKTPDAHIPLDEWLKWQSWNNP